MYVEILRVFVEDVAQMGKTPRTCETEKWELIDRRAQGR